MPKYLDKSGLIYFWGKIKNKFGGTVTSVKINATSPINIDSNSPITTSGERTLSHANSGANAGSYGDSSTQTPSFDDTFKVPYLTVNATGHVTEVSDHTVRLPSLPRLTPTGTLVWFTGNTDKIPSGYLVCNGQAVSRTTYANLYAVLGNKYGSGDGSTTFNLPDLSDGNGRFIRAGFTDSDIGAKQDDKIRNITGKFRSSTKAADLSYIYGAFDASEVSGNFLEGGNDFSSKDYTFNANNDVRNYNNPMAGHADGTDIHPYNIAFLPLIAY